MRKVGQCDFGSLLSSVFHVSETVHITLRSFFTAVLSADALHISGYRSRLNWPVAEPGRSKKLSSEQQDLLTVFSLLAVQVSRCPQPNYRSLISVHLTLHSIRPYTIHPLQWREGRDMSLTHSLHRTV